jgi:hypothetical protein
VKFLDEWASVISKGRWKIPSASDDFSHGKHRLEKWIGLREIFAGKPHIFHVKIYVLL